MKQIFKPSLSLIITLPLLLFATSCENKKPSSEIASTSEQPCGITPEFKEQIKKLRKYEHFQEVQDGLFLVRSKKARNDARGFSYLPPGCVDKDNNVVIPIKHLSAIIGPDVICVQNEDYKWGMFNLKGEEIVPYIYDDMGFFLGDYSIVKQNNRCGIINNKGELVVPIQYDVISPYYQYLSYGHEKYQYEYVFSLFKNGYKTVINVSRSTGSKNRKHIDTPYDYSVLERNGKYGYINYLGEEIPCQYQNARNGYSEGLAAVVKNNKVGFIDKQGNVKIPFKFDYTEFSFNSHSHNFGVFSEGLASMMQMGNKWGYIDKSGNVVIPFQYNAAYCFHEGSAIVGIFINNEERYGLIDKNNNKILPFEFENGVFSGHVNAMCHNGKWGVYSPTGDCITPCQYDELITFMEGYATIVKDGKQGLLDEQGNVIIPCEYETCLFDVWSKVVFVAQNKKWGALDLQNQVIVPTEFDDVGVIDNSKPNLFKVKKNEKYGYYDLCGNYFWL